MQEINTGLLDRLNKALRREQSLLTGIAHEVVSATTFLSRLRAEEGAAKRRADAWPRDPEFEGLPVEDQGAVVVAEHGQVRALLAQQRAAGRQAVVEQGVLQAHVDAARRAGADGGRAAAEFVRSTAQVDRQALQQAWESAAQARRRAEDQLAELEAERVKVGRRAAALRLTLQQGEDWLRSVGLVMESAA